MGMSIDESIDWLDKSILKMRNREFCTIDKFVLNTALETMHKYQKIKQIIDHWTNEDSVGMSDYWMGKIKGVIEDGDINASDA